MDNQAPPFFVRGPTPTARLVFFAALALLAMVVDARFSQLQHLREVLAVIVYPLKQAALAPSRGLEKVSGFFVSQQKLQAENEKARLQILDHSLQLQRYAALEAEVANLRRLLGAKERINPRAVVVEVVQAERNPFSRKILIDKGTRENVQAGQAVIDGDGVVGQVTASYPLSAEVTLITEKSQPIPVMVRRTGLRAVAFGSGRPDSLELPYIPANADIQNGDVLVTSGIDGTYPPGMPVATVTNIERNAAYIFAKITCTPVAGVDHHKFYLVLVADQPDTLTSNTAEDKDSVTSGQVQEGVTR